MEIGWDKVFNITTYHDSMQWASSTTIPTTFFLNTRELIRFLPLSSSRCSGWANRMSMLPWVILGSIFSSSSSSHLVFLYRDWRRLLSTFPKIPIDNPRETNSHLQEWQEKSLSADFFLPIRYTQTNPLTFTIILGPTDSGRLVLYIESFYAILLLVQIWRRGWWHGGSDFLDITYMFCWDFWDCVKPVLEDVTLDIDSCIIGIFRKSALTIIFAWCRYKLWQSRIFRKKNPF